MPPLRAAAVAASPENCEEAAALPRRSPSDFRAFPSLPLTAGTGRTRFSGSAFHEGGRLYAALPDGMDLCP